MLAGITLRKGENIVGIDRNNKLVKTADEEATPYDRSR